MRTQSAVKAEIDRLWGDPRTPVKFSLNGQWQKLQRGDGKSVELKITADDLKLSDQDFSERVLKSAVEALRDA